MRTQTNSLHDLIHRLDQTLDGSEDSVNVSELGPVLDALRAYLRSGESAQGQERDQLQDAVHAVYKALEHQPLGMIARDAHRLHRALTCHAAQFSGCHN